MRKGVTPVVATVLLMTITIGAASTLYISVNSQQNEIEDNTKSIQISLDGLRVENCYLESKETSMTIRNQGKDAINVSRTTLLVNGVPEEGFNVSKELVSPQETYKVNLDYILGQGDILTIKSGGNKLEHVCKNLPRISTISSWGIGIEGDKTVTTQEIVNEYTYLTGSESAGDQKVEVDDASKFSNQEQIMLIQTQKGVSTGKGGQYEFRRIKTISGNKITLENNIENSYTSGTFANSPESEGEVTQVVSVPEYQKLIIDGGQIRSKEWDGQTGGIIAIRAEEKISFRNGGSINSTGTGFRGGTCGSCGDDWDGGRGEGTQGWQLGGGTKDYSDAVSLNNGIGGGGSHVNNNNGGDPAAGGGYATQGETVKDSQSSYNSEGGETIGSPTLSKMFFGGGGGAGSDNDNNNPHPERSDGGGIIFIASKNLENAKIYNNGEDGITGTNTANSYGGNSGAGAGGSVYLAAEDLEINQINASGGKKSKDDGDGEQGGYGGNGRIRTDYQFIVGSSNTDPAIGYEGDVN